MKQQLVLSSNASKYDRGSAAAPGFTSCAVISKCFEDIKGRRGPVLHREELADPAGRWSVDTSHLAIQDRLEVAALTPQQGRNVSEEKDERCVTPALKMFQHSLSKDTRATLTTGGDMYRHSKDFLPLVTVISANHETLDTVFPCTHKGSQANKTSHNF